MRHLTRAERQKVYRSVRRIMKNPVSAQVKAECLKLGYSRKATMEKTTIIESYLKNGTGFCGILEILHDLDMRSLPELAKKRPEPMFRYPWWFPRGHYQRRIQVLNEIIND